MRRADLADLTAFATVADTLNFRAAASRLGVTPSALSHKIRQLEERLGVRLLHRTTRSVSMTDAGLRLLERLRPAIDQIAGALDDLNEARGRPAGRLRIFATPIAASAVVVPVWQRFLSAYPDIQLELSISQEPIDIVAKGFDVGMGLQDIVPADMIAVQVLGPMKIAVIGAPAYFAKHPRPRAPEDLARHDCVRYRPSIDGPLFDDWSFERDGTSRRIRIDGRVVVNNPDLAIRAAVDGLAIAYTLESAAAPFLRSGQVVRVLKEWSPSLEGLFLYYPSRRQVATALRALIDMLRTSDRPTRASNDAATDPLTSD
jgi:DNA-binding transcriptional LysR family regulator